jgi:hypothetical protein
MSSKPNYPTKRTPKSGKDYADYLIEDAEKGNTEKKEIKMLISRLRYSRHQAKIYAVKFSPQI